MHSVETACLPSRASRTYLLPGPPIRSRVEGPLRPRLHVASLTLPRLRHRPLVPGWEACGLEELPYDKTSAQ
eukprot:scaffold5067_cov245-Pinguiococcus_pyrenoidosus.AAC.18